MKMKLECEYADERTTPITIAQAIISFTTCECEDEKVWQENFMEMVDYLNVYANHLKHRIRMDAF